MHILLFMQSHNIFVLIFFFINFLLTHPPSWFKLFSEPITEHSYTALKAAYRAVEDCRRMHNYAPTS